MFASLKNLAPLNGEGGSASAGSSFPFEVKTTQRVTVESLLRAFPSIPPRALVTLAFLAMCDDSVNPFRVCACGCGAAVTGKAQLASPACRKRAQRQRDAQRDPNAKQYQLVMQDEMPFKIPTVPATVTGQAEPTGQLSAVVPQSPPLSPSQLNS